MAKRDKLTHKQKRQVAHQQAQRLKKSKTLPALNDLSEAKAGLLLSRFGEQADILDLSDHKQYRCYLRQNLGSPVSGDKVSFRLAANDQGIVEAIEARSSILERPAQHQGVKPVVANISRIFVVIAPLPDFSAALLDRYLVAVRQANIDVCIIANKWDLVEEIKQQKISEQLKIYQKLGYSVTFVSSKNKQGIDDLKQLACNHKSILVGQSGVGKSSLINQLFPQQSSLVNTISTNSRLGQHTTTASKLFLFEHQNQQKLDDEISFIIDSPGIREFGLWHMSQNTIANGFVEFEDYLGSCKFRDCQHVNEPGCQIIAAVEQQKIDKLRWQSYCKIISEPTD